jgi:hypothetical protein
MKNNLSITLDDNAIRFTPDGKVFILDAIRALSNNDRAKSIWNELKELKPEIKNLFENFPVKKNESVPVADSSGWDKIQGILFDHMLEYEYF